MFTIINVIIIVYLKHDLKLCNFEIKNVLQFLLTFSHIVTCHAKTMTFDHFAS